MSKAPQDKLNELHGAVATVLTAQVRHQEEEMVYDAEGNMTGTGCMQYTASPATIAAAIKFLKDNHTTADIEQDDNMNGLREALEKKQKHSRKRRAGASAAAELVDLEQFRS